MQNDLANLKYLKQKNEINSILLEYKFKNYFGNIILSYI